MTKEINIPCLDHGFVRLVDYMGNDVSVVEAARISTQPRNPYEDQGLINYLMRHRHTSPFEMVEFKFHIKLPIFVMRQWIRHRTANVNEFSMRYREAPEEYYVPKAEHIRKQSTTNKQGSADDLNEHERNIFAGNLVHTIGDAQRKYTTAREMDVAKEMARIGLPLNIYTECYWKIDLHNLLNLLRLRLDHHAQYEIRVYASAIAAIIKGIVPMTWNAFEEYTLGAVTFSRKEMRYIGYVFQDKKPDEFSAGEWREFVEKSHGLVGKI